MLVRAQSIILWNPFLSQPINSSEEHNTQLVSSNGEMLSNHEGELSVAITTNKKNKEQQHFISSISSPSIINTNTTTIVDHKDKEDKGKADAADHSINSTIATTNDDASIPQQNTASSIVSFTAVSSLLNKPIPSYINPTITTTTEESETSSSTSVAAVNEEREEDGLIYYKRREDFYPQFSNKGGEENDTLSSISNIQQARRQNIHNVLGKAATKVHPGEGMPIFKQSSSSSDNLNKLKPKTVFRRIKTMVVKNKKRLATSTL